MKLPSLLHMTAPLREDFDIPFHRIGDPGKKIRLALVAGTHGNELDGIFALSRLADYLHGIQEGRHLGLRLVYPVLIIPAVNILGLNTHMRLWPFDKTDINRMFPGYDQGETTQRIAAAVLKATVDASYRVDLHGANPNFEEACHVRLYDPTLEERATAEYFGLSPIIENRIDRILSTSLIHAWKSIGGANFVLRAGQGGNLQLAHCEKLFEALLNFLQGIGILEGQRPFSREEDLLSFGPDKNFRLYSDHAGFFVSHLHVGRWLQAGDLIGILYDGYTGKVRDELRCPVSGLLLRLRKQPLTCEGDLLARIQTS